MKLELDDYLVDIESKPGKPRIVTGLWTVINHPLVGISGSVASVVGLLLSVYLLYGPQDNPVLTYFVHPVRDELVIVNSTSKIKIQYDGHFIDSDVLSAQIAFWNAGYKSIRREIVLKPMKIRLVGGNILEAKIRKVSRDVADVTLKQTDSEEIELHWNILEHNDGGVVQIIYASNDSIEFQVDCTIEGQKEISKEKFTLFGFPRKQATYTNHIGLHGKTRFVAIVVLFLLMLLSSAMFYKLTYLLKGPPVYWGVIDCFPVLSLIVLLVVLLSRKVPYPPFGF
ncbi:MAG: hypothetical protein PHQ23_03790 [Candidatus Wallbacteria bacterium]|nr:hypothetical protein [Candidatus Wallbacteria bacterium]